MIRRFYLLSLLALSIPLSGCYIEAGPPQSADVYEAPPAPPPTPIVAEAIPPAPGVDAYWVPGSYRWNGHRYDWQRGHYDHRPRSSAHYFPGHWEPRARGHVWVEAHWG